MSWRVLRELFSTGRPPGGPRERSEINVASFWMDLGDIFGALGIIVDGFCDFFRETVNDKLKPGHKNSTNRERTTSAATSEQTTTSGRQIEARSVRSMLQLGLTRLWPTAVRIHCLSLLLRQRVLGAPGRRHTCSGWKASMRRRAALALCLRQHCCSANHICIHTAQEFTLWNQRLTRSEI